MKKDKTNALTEDKQIGKQGLSVVLNGGSTHMDSGIIPVRWFFDRKVIELEPTHILVIDEDENVLNKPSSERIHYGNRYLTEVSKVVDWVEVFKPGKHRFTFIAIKKSDSKNYLVEFRKKYLERDGYGRYTNSIDNTDQNFETLLETDHDYLYATLIDNAIAFTVAEINVPRELFEKKPESKLGKFVWKWVNDWFPTQPKDACEFRKRAIFAFTLQLPLLIIGRFLSTFIGKVAVTLWLIVPRVVVFLFGFRPHPIFESVGMMWWPNPFNLDFPDTYEMQEIVKCSRWKVWQEKFGKPTKRFPVSPVELIALYFVGKLLFTYISMPWIAFLALTACGIVCFVMLYGLLKLSSRFRDWEEARKDAKGKKEEELQREKLRNNKQTYIEWLGENLSNEEIPAKVDFDHLPNAFRTNKALQKTRIHFFATKMKVCKPYAK